MATTSFCALIHLPSFLFFFFLLSLVGGQKHFKGHGDPPYLNGFDHQHSIGYLQGQPHVYGTKAIFSLWDPYVEHPEAPHYEFSLAQIWLVNHGSTLEAGWQVSPSMYGDINPRLFVYWTRDNYKSGSGCYNLKCPGFVQISKKYVPGDTTLSPVSMVNGSQYEITLHVFRDPGSGNWSLYINDEQVGYWPRNLSYLTASYATNLEWGGEIINFPQNGQHTATQMGSGQFAEAGYKKAAYIRNLQWVDVQNNLQNVEILNLKTNAEYRKRYSVVANENNMWGTYFFFGGPGRNSECP